MLKPVLVISYPLEYCQEMIENVVDQINDFKKEYYILIVPNYVNDVTVQCFYEKDIKEIKIKKLQKSIMEKLSEHKQIKIERVLSNTKIRIERGGDVKYSFVSIKDNDSANGKEIILTSKQREYLENILNQSDLLSLD